MDIEKVWEKALKKTEIIRARIAALRTDANTQVPYILLSESSVNVGDTVVRRGEVSVAKPSLIMPPNAPHLNGFEFESNPDNAISENSLINFLIVRGINLPSLKYDNVTSSLDVHEGKLSDAIKVYETKLQREENIKTGLIVAPEDLWQFSLLIFICAQIMKNVNADIQKLVDEYYKRNREQ